jgi:hypothetical protein
LFANWLNDCKFKPPSVDLANSLVKSFKVSIGFAVLFAVSKNVFNSFSVGLIPELYNVINESDNWLMSNWLFFDRSFNYLL